MLLYIHIQLYIYKTINYINCIPVLGVDSEFCNVEALVTGIVDNWPDQLLKHRRKFTIALCFGLFCLGLPLCTNVSILLDKILGFLKSNFLCSMCELLQPLI